MNVDTVRARRPRLLPMVTGIVLTAVGAAAATAAQTDLTLVQCGSLALLAATLALIIFLAVRSSAHR